MAGSQGVQSKINEFSHTISELQTKDAALAEKIKRLKKAKTELDPIYTDDLSFVGWVDTYDVGPRWQGSRREEFEGHKADAKSAGDTYCKAVMDASDSIQERIGKYEGERKSIFWQIQGLRLAISSLYPALPFDSIL